MLNRKLLSSILFGACIFAIQTASAATYYLNQSNTLADGINYAQVNVLENAGNLDFTVNALQPSGWRFSDFYLNLGGSLGALSFLGLPSGWSSDGSQNVSSFGIFSNQEDGNGSSLQSSFTFTVDSTVALSLANLVANSNGYIFAAHVQCSGRGGNECDSIGNVGSHFIAGPGEISSVPVPGAAWLFGSALLGFVGFGNRRKV